MKPGLVLILVFSILCLAAYTIMRTPGTLAAPSGKTSLNTPTVISENIFYAAMSAQPATETVTPVPTVDMVSINATLAAYDVREKQSVANEKQAVTEKGFALATAQSALSTSQAADAIVMIATVTLGAQQLENNQIALTSQSVKATEDEAIRTQNNIDYTATAEYPNIIKKTADAKASANWAGLREFVSAIFWPLVILCVTFLLWLVLRTWAVPRVEVEEVDENQADDEQLRVWNPIQNPMLLAINPPGDQALFARFADYAMNGNLLGINSVENNKAYPRDAYCRDLLPWMQKQDYIGHDPESGGAVLNQKGKSDFALWLEEFSPPPLGDESKIGTPTDHDHDDHDHESGGGVSESEETDA